MKTKMYKFRVALILTFTNLLICSSVWAQTPEKMSYQAVIRNSSDALVVNTQVGMQISILQASADGTVVYTETQTPTSNANGLVSIEIGNNVEFSTIDWANDIYFIKTETDPTGGTNYTITGTSQLLSVPYALHAKTAESVSGGITETDPVFAGWDKSSGISITESQISDLQTYLTTEVDPQFALWDKTTGIIISESQISDLQTYLTSETDPAFTAWDKDYNDLTNTPTIPTVPENVGAFTNDAGYLIEYTETQTLSDVLTNNNSANAQIKNVINPTDAQDAATKAYVDLLEARIEALELAQMQPTDIDGNTYEIVVIGTQVWMAENLKTTHYPNGDAIPLVTDNTAWADLGDNNTDDAYCYYNNNVSSEATTYGALYTYAAAIGDNWARDNTDNQGVCPDGWHLPTNAEWDALTTYLGTDAGSKLAGNAALWTDGDLDQNANFGASGFAALPGGYRYNFGGTFNSLGDLGYWWSATENSSANAYRRNLNYNYAGVYGVNGNKSYGFSVRCVRD